MSAAADVCAQIASARQRFLESVNGISNDDARLRPGPDEWSVIEVLAHMIDVDDFYLEQALLLRDAPGSLFSYFDDDAWKRIHPSPGEFELSDVLKRLVASHARVLEAAGALSEEELARPGKHPRAIPYTVKDVLLRFPAHDNNHRRQIAEIRARLGG
jgi:uncharacterized damage-inducible protein DinB